jgi:hypothetical protein
LPIFRINKAFGVARNMKALLRNQKNAPMPRRLKPEGTGQAVKRTREELRTKLKSKRQEFQQLKGELRHSRKRLEKIEGEKKKRILQQEILQLRNELHGTKERSQGAPGGRLASQTAGGPGMGALPDFVIIGAQKCGTAFLYHLLTQHPHVEPAVTKELHFFDKHFGEGLEWYRECFPRPSWKEEWKSITGEKCPYYMFHPHAAGRMARVVPNIRLIALLRNPVDRAYSGYHHSVRKGCEPLTFEEAIESEETRLRSETNKMLEDERYVSFNHQHFSYLSRGIYVDQLLRWSTFFSKEQLLVLKSEDLFERPQETLKVVLNFLDLPEWEPEAREGDKKYRYPKMNPATRRRLEEYFEPHNRRLYDYLGVDLGW